MPDCQVLSPHLSLHLLLRENRTRSLADINGSSVRVSRGDVQTEITEKFAHNIVMVRKKFLKMKRTASSLTF